MKKKLLLGVILILLIGGAILACNFSKVENILVKKDEIKAKKEGDIITSVK